MFKGSFEGQQQLHHLSSFIRDVNYSCGSCGYELNLNSRNRNTCLTDSNYGKSIKKGLVSFFSVDESRFTEIQQLSLSSWIPFFFNSNRLAFFQRKRTNLLCRNCQYHLGYASHTLPWDGISDSRIFYIKLSSLQPSFCDQPSLPIYHPSSSSSLLF